MKFIRRTWLLLLVLAVVAFFLFRRWRRKARLQRRLAEIEGKLRQHPPFSETAYVLNPDGTDVFPPVTVNATWSYQKPDGEILGPFEKPWRSVPKGRTPLVSLELRFTPEQCAQMKGRILLHSHTTLGRSFSDTDVQLFIENSLQEIRAITRTHRYTMAQSVQFPVSWEQVAKDVQNWNRVLLSRRKKSGLRPFWPRWHALWLLIADTYGFSYHWEPL